MHERKVHYRIEPSLSFITNNAAAPPACATSAFFVKSQSPRIDKAIWPDNCRVKGTIHTKWIKQVVQNYDKINSQ